MAVDLDVFNVLEKELPAGFEVVLIDLRQSAIDGQSRRGLVLHRQGAGADQYGGNPVWISGELLSRIDKLLTSDQAAADSSGLLLTDVRDDAITSGRLYTAAIEKIIDPRPDRDSRDTHWIVLVQEPASSENQ
jgi:hypothetical protein